MKQSDKKLKYEKALEYEIFVKVEYSFAKKEIENAKYIFDIGGHIGLFSKRCRTFNSNAMIHYFEPVEEFYKKAKILLGKDEKLILNNLGIGTKSGIGNILLNLEKTMQSSKYTSFLNPNGKEIKSEFITLCEYLQDKDINKIDVLKMDIEGMEFEVLDSRGDFERLKIVNLIVEIHLFDEEKKHQWNQILLKIKKIFGNLKIINSGYREEIFLVWANKESGL